jgi:transcriptional regulator with XRE-family HTH domain
VSLPADILRGVLVPLDDVEQALLRQTIGLRCRKAREELGLSQRALAQVMDRSASWVREIEAGAQYGPPYLVRALANATGRTIGWFYGDDAPDPQQLAQQILAAVNEGLAVPAL